MCIRKRYRSFDIDGVKACASTLAAGRLCKCLSLVCLLMAGCIAEGRRQTTGHSVPMSSTAPAPLQKIDLLAMGDWGENTLAERQVADAMAQDVLPGDERGSLNAVLLCGDNFYFKLTGVDDPRWQSLFERMYSPAALNVPFYACLGNHDYDGNNRTIELTYSRRHPESRFKLPGEWYRVDLPPGRPMVTVLMLDSNKDNLSDSQWDRQTAWLKSQLESPRAPWTICCAHHPLFSNGLFWGNGVLQNDWGRLFETHHVDFYLCGHEHDLEHLEIPGWTSSFLIAGGGGAHSHPLTRDDRGFSREAYGFVHFELTPTKATVRFLGTDDKPMHVFERTKAGQVRILLTSPNTPRTNPLKAYLDSRGKRPTTQPTTKP